MKLFLLVTFLLGVTLSKGYPQTQDHQTHSTSQTQPQQQVQQHQQKQQQQQPQPQASQQISYSVPLNGKEDVHTEQEVQYSPQYSSEQEIASFDPSIFTDLLPQDAVQQYVTQYGAAYDPSSLAAYAAAYPNPAGYGVQSGYEGYLVPVEEPVTFGILDVISRVLSIPRSLFSLLSRLGAFIISSIGVVLFGGALTTAVCTLTPFCSISFAALPFLGLRSAEDIGKTLKAEITPERVSRAVEFVQNAIEKYNKLQKTSDKTSRQIQKVPRKIESKGDRK